MMFRKLIFVALAGLIGVVANAQPLRLEQVANVSGGYLGVMPTDVNSDRAKALKLPEEAGVEVTQLDPGGPAAAAGLKIGDVVMQYNGQRVEGNEQFSRLVRETPIGREVRLQIYRNGSPQTVAAKIGSRPAGIGLGTLGSPLPFPASIQGTFPDMPLNHPIWRMALGLEVESLDGQLADFFGVKDGLLVHSVIRGSAADRSGFKAGDVILRVGDAKVSNPSDLSSRLRGGRGQSTSMTVMRDHKEVNLMIATDSIRPGEQF